MEYIHIAEAAKKAGVSDKTMRRAYEDGKLTARSRVHKNEPLFIEAESLNAYIASRQSVQTARSEESQFTALKIERLENNLISCLLHVEDLERRMQERENQNSKQQKHIEALEQRVNELRDMHLKKQGDLEDLEVRTTTAFRQEKKEAPALTEIAETTVSTDKIKTNWASVELPDFTRSWQDSYTCKAIHGDVQASCVLLPHPSDLPGQYILTQLFSDKVRARGNITAAQKTRADTLLGHLVEKTREAMLKAGWKEDGFTGLQGQPGTKVLYRKGE